MEKESELPPVERTPNADKRCWFFFRSMGCHNGDACKFSHDDARTPEYVTYKKTKRLLLLAGPAEPTTATATTTAAPPQPRKPRTPEARRMAKKRRRQRAKEELLQQQRTTTDEYRGAGSSNHYWGGAPPPVWYSPAMVPPEMMQRVPSVHCPYCWFFMTHECVGDRLLLEYGSARSVPPPLVMYRK